MEEAPTMSELFSLLGRGLRLETLAKQWVVRIAKQSAVVFSQTFVFILVAYPPLPTNKNDIPS
jgi:hypothetical protein